MGEIIIYQTEENQAQVEVRFKGETFWLSLKQISALFERDKSVISRHLRNIFKEKELDKNSVVAKNATTASDGKTYQVEYYNLDAILSVGYRVNSKRGTQFRKWATQRLKEYFIHGYTINKKLLEEKNNKIKHLKSSIQILSRTIERNLNSLNGAKGLTCLLADFSNGLNLLDDYDNEQLDKNGKSINNAIFISYDEFIELINAMRQEFNSGIFAKEKDNSFKSSITQIYQSFGGQDLYSSLEEKAAMLIYLIVKNHPFIDGNKRIAAACFLYFLEKNKMLYDGNGNPRLSNDTLVSLTLFIAESQPNEMETVKYLTISILNRMNE
ncbi:MAG: virulence protein RhuM/Fic/DOC family protein [Candidatus Magnetomorum sp.]|nr:virulence protein RhuM/Fic/DOC family protein [Candidatus Magnetomorum sp.]